MILSKYFSSDLPFGTKVFMAPTSTEIDDLMETWIKSMERGKCRIKIIEDQGPNLSTIGKSQNGGNCTLSFRYRIVIT